MARKIVVYETPEAALQAAHEDPTESLRAYEVSGGDKKMFVVAKSPTEAVGKVGPYFGIDARPLETRGPGRRVQKLVERLTEEDKEELRKLLRKK